ncbi:MAG: hypothetical protein J3K34DRAFT_489198 [Monoraphidium minutum]|nr:MAG: hypothetical protein J3K34DRAFT_489198 [Monoraphidium minutum]
MSGKERVLSYYDVLLRRLDVELLEGPHWLNDTVIEFWFEHLARGPYAALAAAAALVPPATAFLLLHASPSDARELLAPLQLHTKDLVLLPVSDNPDAAAAGGGSHWSLLAFDRSSNAFHHIDSASGSRNRAAARLLAGAASPLVQGRAAPGAPPPAFLEPPGAPRQDNGHDCGVFVMAAARQLLERRAAAGGGGGVAGQLPLLGELVTPSSVAALRREARQLIDELVAAEAAGR